MSVNFNKIKPIDLWEQRRIVGKRTGPIHQDLTSKSHQGFSISITLSTTKRKADQFGKYLSKILEEYTEYLIRMVFLDRSGYSAFNYSSDSSEQNCYLTRDEFPDDIINGSVTRNVEIVMLDLLS
jgi:hypothetical protein